MKARSRALGALLIVGVGVIACSSQRGSDGEALGGSASPAAPSASTPQPPTRPNYFAGPPDFSRSVVQHGPRVTVAHGYASRPLRDLPDAVAVEDRFDHEPGRNPFTFLLHAEPDAV